MSGDGAIRRCNSLPTAISRAKFERFEALRQQLGDKASLANSSAQQFISLEIRYVVIPMNTTGTIGLDQIRANHDVVNAHFRAYQKPAGLTNTVHYPYFELNTIMGDPGITFAPADSSQVTAEFMSVPTPATSNGGFASVQDAEAEYKRQGGTIAPGVVYVYITTIAIPGVDGAVLGLAKDLISNALMVDYRTVGSPSSLGPAIGSSGTSYSAGKTMVHELGHCFGLYHPFPDDGVCDATYQLRHNPQSPVQKNPNYYASLEPLTAGTGTNCLDNRGRDQLRFCTGSATCSANTTSGLNPGESDANVAAYSCATRSELTNDTRSDLTSNTLPFETFMHIMDYGQDAVALGFPSANVRTMRAVLQTHPELYDIALVSDPHASVSPAASVAPADASFPTWAIAVICAVGGVVVLTVLVVVVLAATGRFKRRVDTIKPLQAYQTPFLMKQYL